MRIIFLVEERSMKELLEILLPKILPDNMANFLIIPHNGKGDLAASIPRKLQAWQNLDDKFVIVHDQDSNDCKKLKEGLLEAYALFPDVDPKDRVVVLRADKTLDCKRVERLFTRL